MKNSFARDLDTNPLAKKFAVCVLGVNGILEVKEATEKIVSAELQLVQIDMRNTMCSSDFRSPGYEDDESRKKLREKILKELMTMPRLEDDDKIKLGKGGALPSKGDTIKERQAYIIIGLPASGKSSIASIIADKTGSIIVDSDYAKRKFPEFTNQFGATIVHDESSAIVFSDTKFPDELNLSSYCLLNGCNMVIPRIGHNLDSILDYAKFLKEKNYLVHLTLVSLDRKKATLRAYNRFCSSGRYVPLSLIFDIYSNEPTLTYYRLKDNHNDVFESFGKISSDVKIEEKCKVIDYTEGNPACFLN